MIKPYYENDLGKLYHGDCLEIMPYLYPVDLVLTDPPYGIGESNEKNLSRSNIARSNDYGAYTWDKEPPPPVYFEMLRIYSKNQIIFGGNYFIEWLKNSSCWIVWDKDNGKSDFADCELAWTSFKSAVRMIKWRWNGMLKEVPEKRFHPTQKPLGLFQQLLQLYSMFDDTIMDTHIGSGTTAIACERLKRKWIGIEIEEKYCEIAAKRIKAERKQLKLF